MPAGLEWTQEQYRDFARRYITERFAEDEVDTIEEMSAYISDWMLMRDRMKRILGEEGLLRDGDTERVWPIDPSLTKETT